MTQAKQQYCKACGQPIRWVKTKSGKFTPIDLDGMTHWATCTGAEQFRSDRPKVKEDLSQVNKTINRWVNGD